MINQYLVGNVQQGVTTTQEFTRPGGAGDGCGTLGVKGTTVGTIIIAQVPWSLCAKGTTEQE